MTTCPACKVPYTDHLGLNGTCEKLQAAEAIVKRLDDAILEQNTMAATTTEEDYALFYAVKVLKKIRDGEKHT